MQIGNVTELMILIIIYVPCIVLSIYMCVLFIKLARRGIKALDIYIENNKNKDMIDKVDEIK